MLDRSGFKRKMYSDLITDLETEARSRFGQNVNTSALSPLGILLRIFAYFLSLLWMDTENVYNSAYIGTAEGTSLDRLGPYVGATRGTETWATGTVSIVGDASYTLPAGFRVGTAADTVFETTADAVLDANGQGSAPIRALEAGKKGNVGAGEITQIINPNPSITSVTNDAATAGGQDTETDEEFREKFRSSVAGGGAASVPAITGALLRLDGVRAATVIENYSMNPDAGGRPPKSFQAYVLGGDRQLIADTIFNIKAGGIESFGDETVTVLDIAGTEHDVSFSYSTEVPISVRVDVTTNDEFPSDGADRIRSAIIKIIGGVDTDGAIRNGLNMGDDVIHSRLVAAAFAVEGVVDATVTLSTDGVAYAAQNVAISPQSVAQANAARIEVTAHA